MNILKRNSKISDIELVELYQKTVKSRYLGELFTRYSAFSLAVCIKYLKNKEKSKDAVMDIFEKLATDLKTQEISYFKSWFYSVIRNHCLMFLRTEKGKQKHEENLLLEQEYFMEKDDNMHLNDKDIQLNKMELVQKAISKLNDEQQSCIKLFYYEEKSYQEIVNITGYALTKVKSYLQNGKRKLQIALENELQMLKKE